MLGFVIGKGLVIRRAGLNLEFLRRSGTSLWFTSVEGSESISILEADFWEEWGREAITIVPAVASTTEIDVPDEGTTASSTKLAANHADAKALLFQDRMRSYIDGLIDAGISIGQVSLFPAVIAAVALTIADASPPSEWQIYRQWHKLITADGDSGALGHAARGSVVGSRAGKDIDALADQAINEHYLTLRRPSVASTMAHYEGLTRSENVLRLASGQPLLHVISHRTFRRRIDALDAHDKLVARHGFVRARAMLRQAQGDLFAEHAADVIEFDDTPVNLWVVDDQTGIPLGRPYITAGRCRGTRALMGFYVTFQAPSARSAMGALKHTLLPHSGIKTISPEVRNSWVMHGLGRLYLFDNGSAYKDRSFRHAILHGLGSRYRQTETRLPWHKAGIERTFLDFEHLLETMPGRTFSHFDLRGDYDPKKDAVVTFSNFVSCLHIWGVDIYNFSAPTRGGPTPFERWSESVAKVPMRYPRSSEALDVIMGELRKGRLSHDGVQIDNLKYCDENSKLLVSRAGDHREVEFLRHHENMGSIHILKPGTREPIRVACTWPDYAEGKSIYQHKIIQAQHRAFSKGPYTQDSLLEAQLSIANRISADLERAHPKRAKSAAQAADLNSERVEAGDKRSGSEPFAASTNAKTNRSKPANDADVTDVPTFKWG